MIQSLLAKYKILFFTLVSLILFEIILTTMIYEKEEYVDKVDTYLNKIHNDFNFSEKKFDEVGFWRTDEEILQDIDSLLLSLNRLLDYAPNDTFYRFYRALILERLANISISSVMLNEYTSLGSNQVKYLVQAVEDLQFIILHEGFNPTVEHNLGWLYFILGNHKLAIQHIKNAVRTDSFQPIFYLSLGLMKELTFDQTANDDYLKAICLSSEIIYSKFFKDYQLRSPKTADSLINDAIMILSSYPNLELNPIIQSRIGVLFYYTGQISEAKNYFIKSKYLLPNLSKNYYYLGLISEGEKNYDEAKKMLKIATRISTTEYLPVFELANLEYTNQNDSLVIYFYRKSLERYRDAVLDANRSLKRKYHTSLYQLDKFIPKGIYYYTLPVLDKRKAAFRISECYESIGNQKLSVFFSNYEPLYSANIINQIGDSSFINLAAAAYARLSIF